MGRRCGSQDGLQFEHRVPVAPGGPDAVENIVLLRSHHNRLRAEQVFGRERIGAIIARKQQRAVTSPVPSLRRRNATGKTPAQERAGTANRLERTAGE